MRQPRTVKANPIESMADCRASSQSGHNNKVTIVILRPCLNTHRFRTWCLTVISNLAIKSPLIPEISTGHFLSLPLGQAILNYPWCLVILLRMTTVLTIAQVAGYLILRKATHQTFAKSLVSQLDTSLPGHSFLLGWNLILIAPYIDHRQSLALDMVTIIRFIIMIGHKSSFGQTRKAQPNSSFQHTIEPRSGYST